MAEQVKQFFKDRHVQLVLLITAFALVLRFKYAYISGFWVDEGGMSVKAASILEHPLQYSGYFNDVLTKRPPVFIYMLVFAQWLMGVGKMAVRSVSPLIGGIAVFASYYLGKTLYGKREGVILAALLAVSPVFWFLSERVLIGVTLTLWYLLAMTLFYYAVHDGKYARYAWWALGLVIGLGVMTKPQFWAVAPIIVTYLLAEKGLAPVTDWKAYKDMYIAAGIALVTMLPWMIHSIRFCNLPLCNFSRVFGKVGAETVSEHAITGGMWYYITNLGSLLSLPVAAVIYLRYTVGTGFKLLGSGVTRRVKYTGLGAAVGAVAAYVIRPELLVLVVLLGYAFLQEDQRERFLLLWVAWGIGLITLTAIKVPRYAVFIVPALLLLAAHTLVKTVETLGSSYNLSSRHILIGITAATLLLGAFSYMQGQTQINGAAPAFKKLDPAGASFQGRNNVTVMASSKNQIAFFSYLDPNVVSMPGKNTTDLEKQLRSGEIDYVVADLYERTRQKTVQHLFQNLRGTNLIQPVNVFEQDLNGDGRPDPVVVIFEVNNE